jgi:RNA polymerase sigma-70 factor (ECF subfamily)
MRAVNPRTRRKPERIPPQKYLAGANPLRGRERHSEEGHDPGPAHKEYRMTEKSAERAAFEQLMVELRPRLHRYCARMVGSAFDGEDVVQDALAKAAEAFPDSGGIERPENWLFRIAHNTALDALRARKRRPVESEIDLTGMVDESAAADARVAAAASLATFLLLPPGQRASVVLADVLGHSLEETAAILDMTVPAVKAALNRARTQLKGLGAEDAPAPDLPAAERMRLQAYADRFNARDFDALRGLLAEDVRLDLVNRRRLDGRKDVSVYFTRYGETSNWHFAVGLAEGRPVLLVSDPAAPASAVRYVVLLGWTNDGKVATIRDFFYAPYVIEGLRVLRPDG